MSRQTISDLLGLQGPHAVMQRVRESTERYGGGVELLKAKLNCCDYRQKVSTSGLVDWTTLCLSVHCSLAFAATAGSNTTSDSSMKVSEWLARGSDLGSFFGRDRREYPNHTRPPGYSRHYCAMWDRQGPSSVDYQPYANLGAAWNTSSSAARARALLQGATGKPPSPRAAREEPSLGRQSPQGDSSGGSSKPTKTQKIPAPSNGALLEQTKVVKKQLEELRESHFLSKCRNLLGVSDFSAQPPHPTQPQVEESSGEGSASSERHVHIAQGVELDGASSRECDSDSARTGSVRYGDKPESMDEYEASVGSDHCSLPRNIEVAVAASLETTHTGDVSEHGQKEWPQHEASDLTGPLRPAEPKVVRHIYRYAHYDEFGSDASRGDESSMQWLESGDEGYKTDEFDEKGYYSSFDDGPSDDQNKGKGVPTTPNVEGRMGNSCGAKEFYKSQTSTDNDLRAQFNRENCWASDGGHRRRFTAIPVPSAFSASRSAQTKLGGHLGESQENVNSVTAGGNRNVLGSTSSEGCKKASDTRECLKSISIDSSGEIGPDKRKSQEEASLPVSDQENKAFSDGVKLQATEAIQKDSDRYTTTHPSVRVLSVLSDSRNLENEKEVVKARTAEIQVEIRESLRGSQTSTDKPRKETEIANACTVGIQTERESLILRKTETASKHERLDTSTQTSSKEPIPQAPKEKLLDGPEFDLKDQQSGAEWLSEIIPKELLDRFALEGIKSTTTNVVPDQFHLHLHFAEKETLRDAKVETKNRGAEVERDAKQPLQTSIQNFHQEEDRQPSILKESSSGVPPAWPPNPDSDGGGEQVESGEASWDVLRSLCKTMGETVQEACQKMSESEPTTDTDQSTETPRRPIMSHEFHPGRAQDDRNQSSRYMRTEAPGLQDSYQRDGYYNRVDSHEGFHNEAHYIRERERSQLKHQQNGYNGKSRRNMSHRDSRSRDFHDSTNFVEEFDRRCHNGFSGQAMERFASSQRGMNVYPPRGAEESRYPRYMPYEQHFQPADHHGQYPESFESDLNSLPSIFSPAVVDRSVHEVEERWRVHQEHLMNKIRQANSGSSGQPSRSGRSRYAASRNGTIPRRIHEENGQSGRERSSSSELQRVARDMAMLASRLQNGSRK
ncbi:hypothetical protein BSKO_09163 [Bryopsis sp. KO-2023]|nr:hypothetical protein BSKO_09163 [Bryopsis sp. KO-2023]